MNQHESRIQLARKWHQRASRRSVAHHIASENYMRFHRLLGFPVIISTSLLGALTQFPELFEVSLRTSGFRLGQAIFLLLSVVATVLVSLQTFWNFSELSDRHRRVGSSWEGVRMELEEAIHTDFELDLQKLRVKIKGLLKDSPHLKKKVWTRAESEHPKCSLNKEPKVD